LNFSNILIAGGFISNLLLQNHHSGDVDIFFYNLNITQANTRLPQLIEDLITSYKTYCQSEVKKQKDNPHYRTPNHIFNRETFNPNDFQAYRNKNQATLELPGFKFQIIFRLYTSISEILHGFDLGSSAVGFDGSKTHFTTLSKFSYEYSANIVDTSRRSTTYEQRLAKYFTRGFAIILPQLDISTLRTENLEYNQHETLLLPFMKFSYSKLQGKKISFERFVTKKEKVEHADEMTDYGETEISRYQVFFINLRNIIRKTDNFYFFSFGDYVLDIFDTNPTISDGLIEEFYDKLAGKLYSGGRLKVKTLMQYFDVKELKEICLEFLEKRKGGKDKEYFQELCDLQKKKMSMEVRRIYQEKEKLVVAWRTDNPGTQLTSSVNPIFEVPEKWYGKHFLKG